MSIVGAGTVARASEVRYAHTADGAQIAYQVIGGSRTDGRDLVLLTAGTTPMGAFFEDPVGARLLEGLADLGRLVLFDRSGIGLSDPPADWTLPPFARWCSDLEAVVTAAGANQPVLVSMSLSGLVALLYCDRHAGDVAAMVMVEPYPPEGLDRSLVQAQLEGHVDSVSLLCPSRADEPGFREWFTHAGQLGASPRLAAHAHPTPDDDERAAIERAATNLGVPTLVLRRPAHPLSPPVGRDEIVALIPGAVRVDVPGSDLLIFGDELDAALAETTRFVTGEDHLPQPERILAAVLFTDLVSSTQHSASVGDLAWKRLLDRHDEFGRACIRRRGGRIVNTTGDGLVAVLPTATSAVRAAQDLRRLLAGAGLDVRVGIHVGEVEDRGHDVSGIGVAIAARIMALAGAGEVFVSEVVPGVVTGSQLRFTERGRHDLKGVPGEWRIYALDGE